MAIARGPEEEKRATALGAHVYIDSEAEDAGEERAQHQQKGGRGGAVRGGWA